MQGSEFGDTSYAEYQTGNQGNENIAFDKVSEVFRLGQSSPRA